MTLGQHYNVKGYRLMLRL